MAKAMRKMSGAMMYQGLKPQNCQLQKVQQMLSISQHGWNIHRARRPASPVRPFLGFKHIDASVQAKHASSIVVSLGGGEGQRRKVTGLQAT